MAHELNSHPLPVLPESFDVIRLPPAHQRLAEVNFDLLPDQSLRFDDIRRNGDGDEGDESDSSEEEEEEVMTDEGGANGDAAEDDADGEDEEMEEVGVEPPPMVERDMDEDYDA
jgi:transcription initiation factor TFIID subunit 9B